MKKSLVKTLAIGITTIAVIAIVCIAAFASSETNFAAAPAEDTAEEVVLEQEVNDAVEETVEEEDEEETEAPEVQQQAAQPQQAASNTQANSNAQRTNNTQRTNNNNTAAQPQQAAPAAETQAPAAEAQAPAAEAQAPAPAAETQAPAPAPETQAPAPAGPTPTYGDVSFVGVLHIPSAGINVELYASAAQYVTDRQNSANCFSAGFFPGKIIADHSSQAFRSLTSVHAGTSGYIEYANGSVRNISCATAFTGHNTDYELTDDNYNTIPGGAFALYTCMGSWQNIYVAIFN